MDRALVAFAAYCLPAFPARWREGDDVSSATSGEDGETGMEWDFDMQMATALSLSANDCDNAEIVEDAALQEALEASLMANPRDNIGSVPGTLQNLPDYVLVHSIRPDGWCFYDSVLKQLYPDGQDGTECEQVTTAMVAGLCLSCLAQQREHMECFLADSEEYHVKRIDALSRVPVYRRYVNTLDRFNVYVLDKLEAALRPTVILDTHHYADFPEIEACRRTFGLSMLRLRPANDWRENDIGNLQKDMDVQVIADDVHLRSLLASSDVDLKMLHYQYPGFEHYDVISSTDSALGIAEPKKTAVVRAIEQSSLLQCLKENNVLEYRRNALLLVGVVADPALFVETISDAGSSCAHTHESDDSSEDGQSTADSGGSVIEKLRANTDQQLPSGVPTTVYPRIRGKRFCAGYNSRTECVHDGIPDLPPDVPTPCYPRVQEMHFLLSRSVTLVRFPSFPSS